MTIERLEDLKKYYQSRIEYFTEIGFERLKADYENAIEIIDEFIVAIQPKEPEPELAQEDK